MSKRHQTLALLLLFIALDTACGPTVPPSPSLALPATDTPVMAKTATRIPTSAPVSTPAPSRTQSLKRSVTATMLPSPTVTATVTSAPQTHAVVVVIIDGARWSETLGDRDAAVVPHLARDLAPMGAINTAFYNDGATLSVPGHAALLTGTWQDIPNDGTTRPTKPTIFEYFRRVAGVDDAVFVHGSTIEPVLTYSTHPDFGASFGASMRFSDEPHPPYDVGMWANARQVMTELQPRLLVISLLDPDEAAHLGQWEAYRAAIQYDDAVIWDLWQQLQGDAFYAGRTTLFVTSDHGRGCGLDWPNHGSADDCNRHVLFLAVGPEIPPGQVETHRRTLVDIAPTVGALLRFETPLAVGEVMLELFDD